MYASAEIAKKGTTEIRSESSVARAPASHVESRRVFLKGLSAAIALTIAGCAPTRYFLKRYDTHYYDDVSLRESFLLAFVATIVPGCERHADVIRIFTDRFYPFAEHLPYFLADLARRAEKVGNTDRFDCLPEAHRIMVVESGLTGDCVSTKLYNAAILMAQASVYAGIYDPERGCELIDFPGANTGFARDEFCHADNSRFIRIEMTRNGYYD